MGILELAKMLGEEIKKDRRMIEFEEAKNEYENNEELKNALKEYEVQRKEILLQLMQLTRESMSFIIKS